MSTEFVWKHLNDGKDAPLMPNHYPAYIDVSFLIYTRLAVSMTDARSQVRDAAEAHYQAVVRGAQGRFPLAAGCTSVPPDLTFWPGELTRLQHSHTRRWRTSRGNGIRSDKSVSRSVTRGNTKTETQACTQSTRPKSSKSLASNVSEVSSECDPR